MNLIIFVISCYIMFSNIKFLESDIIAYIILIFLIGYAIYSKSVLNNNKKYVINNSLRLLLKFLMCFSIFIAILGLSKNFIKVDSIIYGFDEYKQIEAYKTGIVNFILCAISYLLILPAKTIPKRRIK